jgi:hypothetical protein
MSHDPDEMRHHSATAAAELIDCLDDETLALCDPFHDAALALAGRLQANGMGYRGIASVLVGLVLATVLDE